MLRRRDTTLSNRQLAFRKPKEVAHCYSAKLNKKGSFEFTFANIFSIFIVLIFMAVWLVASSICSPEPTKVHIKAGYFGEVNDVLKNLLQNDVEGYEGDFSDYVIYLMNEKKFEENKDNVKEIIDEFLINYENYAVNINDEGRDADSKIYNFMKGDENKLESSKYVKFANYRIIDGEEKEFDYLVFSLWL